jgi:cell division inhibitor SepF
VGALRKTLVYLGLADDAYDDPPYDVDDPDGRPLRTLEEVPDTHRDRQPERHVERQGDRGHDRPAGRGSDRGMERHLERQMDRVVDVRPGDRRATVTPLPHIVGAQGPMHRITAVHPRSYNDARVIGEHFREGTPVIMNLTEMEDGDAKRLVDFAAGLVYGLQGVVERVTTKVFLLSPAAIEVTNEVQEPATPTGFFNQS